MVRRERFAILFLGSVSLSCACLLVHGCSRGADSSRRSQPALRETDQRGSRSSPSEAKSETTAATTRDPSAANDREPSRSAFTQSADPDSKKLAKSPDSSDDTNDVPGNDVPESPETGPNGEPEVIVDETDKSQDVDQSDKGRSSSTHRAPSPFRLLLPTTAGVLLVDLEIAIGGQALSQAFDRRIESVLEAAASGDALTWRGLLEHIKSNPQLFGSVGLESQSADDLERVYDRNRNRQPDPEEAARLIFRNGGYPGPFRLVGTSHYRQTNRSRSPVFAAMDGNADGVLNQEEIVRAGEALRRLDRNGDRRLDFAEIDPSTDARSLDRPWNERRVSRWGDVAMDLGGFVDWSMVAYALQDASQQGIFRRGPNVISRIDENQDHVVTANEARRLLEVDADIFLSVRFDSPSSSKPRVVAEVLRADPATEIHSSEGKDRIGIRSDQLRLMVTAVVRSGSPNAIPPEVFERLDADDNGELDENEIPNGALREYSFDDLDRDDNGRLSYRELAEGMAPPEPIWTVQVRSRGAEVPDAILSWLDQNQDGGLSTRELVASSERLGDLAGAEGSIAAKDFPDTFLVQFVRGDPRQDGQLFALTPASPTRLEGWPLWAQSMDVNQDGDIAKSEFLGSLDQFNALDRDRDGFLQGAEIRSD